jgi:hypothetical protein
MIALFGGDYYEIDRFAGVLAELFRENSLLRSQFRHPL